MNPWSRKTVHLAKKQDYLDRLYAVYPREAEKRMLDPKNLEAIEVSYRKRDRIELLTRLLDLEKFPFKDSYISFLRSDRTAIKRNPKTVKRITDALFQMGFENVKKGILEPKEANTRRGQQFRNWVKQNFRYLGLEDFKKSTVGIVFLDDSEKNILDFCNTELGLGISKRPDFVAKSKGKYVVGEAKFLSSLGGNQGRGFDDAIKLASQASGSAYKVAVIDGVLWIQSGSQEYRKVEYTNVCAFSALLLKDYLSKL